MWILEIPQKEEKHIDSESILGFDYQIGENLGLAFLLGCLRSPFKKSILICYVEYKSWAI